MARLATKYSHDGADHRGPWFLEQRRFGRTAQGSLLEREGCRMLATLKMGEGLLYEGKASQLAPHILREGFSTQARGWQRVGSGTSFLC